MIKIIKQRTIWNLILWFCFNKSIKITSSRDGWSSYYVDALILICIENDYLKKRKN